MAKTQQAPMTAGDFKQMEQDLVACLPTELVEGAYTSDPPRYNRAVRNLVRLPSGVELAQIERILSTGAFSPTDFTNQHAGRRATPARAYPDPWPILTAEQWAEGYQKAHPELDASCIVEIDPLLIPSWCDQRVQWRPRLDLLGKRIVGASDPYGDHYGVVLEYTTGKLTESYGATGFQNYREGALTQRHVRLNEHTRQYLQWSDAQSKGDYVPEFGSFGQIYAGYGVSDARGDVQARTDRWAWPFFVAGNILIVDHVRHGANGLLHTDLGGDEYDPDGPSRFQYCLDVFFFDRLGLNCYNLDDPSEHWGMAVGWSRR